MNRVRRYSIRVQVRTNLTQAQQARYLATATNEHGPKVWPMEETGDVIHARSAAKACAFYRALKSIKPIIKIRARVLPIIRGDHRNDTAVMRAWRGFECITGGIAGAWDEVKHFPSKQNGVSACGLDFTEYYLCCGKPECDKCLAAAIGQHPEMGQYL